jgi:uracil-DNA glycosylase family protein
MVSAGAGIHPVVAARNPYPTAAAFMPDTLSLTSVREAVQHCEGCPLYADATQAVFGEGLKTSEVMLVGEQPGDQEDLAGAPFVGPAGKLLDRALDEAGIDRDKTYVTNAVKHFKWKARGKRRIHDKPTWTETMACRPWLDAEIALVKPRALVLMGATAGQSVLGKTFRVTQHRGVAIPSDLAELVTATIHPSAVLRGENREELFAGLVDDLRLVAETL